jgi:hypothetical protein
VSVVQRLTTVTAQADGPDGQVDPRAAQKRLREALDASIRPLGPDHPDVLAAARVLAALHRRLGELSQARTVLEEGLAGGLSTIGMAHPAMLALAHDLGHIAAELENRHEARRNFEHLQQFGPDVLGPAHPYVAAATAYLAGQWPVASADAEPSEWPEPPDPAPPAPPDPPIPPAPEAVRPFIPRQRSSGGPTAQTVRRAPSAADPTAARSEPSGAGPTATPAEPATGAVSAVDDVEAVEPDRNAPPNRARQISPSTDVVPYRRSRLAPSHRPGPLSAHPDEITARRPQAQGTTALALPQPPWTIVPPSRPLPSRPTRPVPAHRTGRRLSRPVQVIGLVLAIVVATAAAVEAVRLVRDVANGTGSTGVAASGGRGRTAPEQIQLRLEDRGTAVVLRWTDAAKGETPFSVEYGPADGPANRSRPVPAGITTITVDELDERTDYCFTVVAVNADPPIPSSHAACTRRTTPSPATSN